MAMKKPRARCCASTSPARREWRTWSLAARHDIRYVNIEVSLDNPRQQKQMLAWAEKNLP